MDISTKHCKICNEVKPVVDFYFYKSNNQYSTYCKPCGNAKTRAYLKANPSKRKKYKKDDYERIVADPVRHRDYLDKKNVRLGKQIERDPVKYRDYCREKEREYFARNPGLAAKKIRELRRKNPDWFKNYERGRWANPELRRILEVRKSLRAAMNRARDYNGYGDRVEYADWFCVLEIFDNKCAYCDSENEITIDHIVALSKGGRNIIGNLVPACRSCNSQKCAKSVESFSPERADEIIQKAQIPLNIPRGK